MNGVPSPGFGSEKSSVIAETDGGLSIFVAAKRVRLQIDVPASLELRRANFLSLILSTDSVMGFMGSMKSEPGRLREPNQRLFFYDKNAKVWETLAVRGDSPLARSLGGNWVGILETEMRRLNRSTTTAR